MPSFSPENWQPLVDSTFEWNRELERFEDILVTSNSTAYLCSIANIQSPRQWYLGAWLSIQVDSPLDSLGICLFQSKIPINRGLFLIEIPQPLISISLKIEIAPWHKHGVTHLKILEYLLQ